jgi:hypothetical protein
MTNDKNMERGGGSTGWRVVLLEAIRGTKISSEKRRKKKCKCKNRLKKLDKKKDMCFRPLLFKKRFRV